MKITTTKKTFEELVEANNFDWKYITKSYKPQKPKINTVDIELWHPNKTTTNQEFLDYCKANNSRPATFNEALQLALENLDLQKKHRLVTYDLEQLCGLYLGGGADERDLHVNESYPDYYWGKKVRFLVVPAPSVPASSGKLGNSALPLETLPFDPSKLSFEYDGRKFKIVEEKFN